MTLQEMMKALGISRIPDCFPAYYEQLKGTWEKRGEEILSDEFILQALEKSGVLTAYQEVILLAAAQVRENPALVLLICLLEQWVKDGGNVNDPAYEAPEGVGIGYDLLHLFPAIPAMPDSVEHMRKRGVPEDVITATMGEYDFCMDLYSGLLGRPGFNRGRLAWISRLVNNKLIRIGRFKYDLPGNYIRGVRVFRNQAGDMRILADGLQVHAGGGILGSVGLEDPEGSFLAELCWTEAAVTGYPISDGRVCREQITLQLTQWHEVLSEEDAVLRIHIPRDGSFDTQVIEEAYAQAREIFAKCYPDYPYKAFFCHSWLMSLDLREVLKPTSNILAFQKKFTPIPCKSAGNTVFSFVFGKGAVIPEDLQALPENTSLQRAVKARYLQGGYIREGEGFFF